MGFLTTTGLIVMTHIMIDIETLGTNNDSQILSIGACEFDAEGIVSNTFYNAIRLKDNEHVKTTPSTLEFWASQGNGLSKLLADSNRKPMCEVLLRLSTHFNWEDARIWANGTKFDISMLESVYKSNDLAPWKYNADRCMRTLKEFAGKIDVSFEGTKHHALDDAIWQAKYVAAACKKLGLVL
jgi:inhibitor of KinA sporulation pathway (predicted exonuclease)